MTFLSRLSLTFVVALAAAPVHAEGLVWLTDYNSARREAQEKALPLVIDFSTQNCHWCRQLEATTFRDAAVVKLVSEHFVALHLDGEKDADIAQALGVTGYPTLILADPSGKILGRQEGYVKAAEFTQILQRALVYVPPPHVDPQVRQAAHVSATPPEPLKLDGERTQAAGQLLSLAKADYQEKRFVGCLDRCKTLQTEYADLAEGTEAQRLESKIRRDPALLKAACDSLAARLGDMYLDMAEAFILQGQAKEAVPCLEWVLQARPGTPQADAAKAQLKQIKEH